MKEFNFSFRAKKAGIALMLVSVASFAGWAQGNRKAQELIEITNNQLQYVDRFEVILRDGNFDGVCMLWGWQSVVDQASIDNLRDGKTFLTPRMRAKAYTVQIAKHNGVWAINPTKYADLTFSNDQGMNEELHLYNEQGSWHASRVVGHSAEGRPQYQKVNRLRISATMFGQIEGADWGFAGQ